MAGERTLPGLGLRAFYTDGSDGWGQPVSEDLRLLSAFAQLIVSSVTAAVPASPSDGTITVDPSAGTIKIRDAGAWIDVAPFSGCRAWVVDASVAYVYDGSEWIPEYSEAPEDPGVEYNPETRVNNVSLTNSLTDGTRTIFMSSTSDTVITIPSGLIDPKPVTIVRSGSGNVTISAAAGVTLNTADNGTKLRAQHSAATILPLDNSTYTIVGDLTV